MATMTFQRLDLRKRPLGGALPVQVQFNPTEFSLSKGAQFAEVAIPGLESPILQFINGTNERLSMELFFDSTEAGMGPGATPVTTKLDPFYRMVRVDGELHAPPIVRILWGDQFPGVTTDESQRPLPAFDCVVESVDRKYTLFNPDGVPLRATLTLALREYKTLEEQLQQMNLRSADHTRVHIVQEGETLPQIAFSAYENPADWRLIASHNDILHPRDIRPGMVLELPPRS